ncbi:MAG TPA: helix-turn-helix domain-containing protein [Ferruginibacter sp.]|nr:helix-turn-helix domain-containing protein [Ferruginibacter sp.]HMP20349.1 helix-turn-helix domain-containing protein [Ferruginibacter sp.]
MKHLTILAPIGKGNNLSSIVGAYKIFSRANAIVQSDGLPPVFDICVAGASGKQDYFDGLFSIQPHTHFSTVEKTDLVIIPAVNYNNPEVFEQNKTMVEWIAQQYSYGAEVASICTGAFLLAATGILNGRKCSTHWAAQAAFRSMYPEVDLQADFLITDENGICTNGGAYSFLNLLFHLIEKYYSRPVALLCAKIFQIDISRQCQAEFMIFSNQKLHNDDLVKEAQVYIESHVEEKIVVESLCKKFAIARRNFDRRFVRATGNSPLEYIQRTKIEAAKRSLEQSRKTINEIMYDCGYTDIKAFREVFKKNTGLTPTEYKEKYSKDAVALS